MIKEFKNKETRDSALIYKSTLEQIKKLHAFDKEAAYELAVAAFESALGGEISSDNPYVEIMLESIRVVNVKNAEKYDRVKNRNNEDIRGFMYAKNPSERYGRVFRNEQIDEFF